MASDPRQLDLHLGRQGLHARAFQAHVSADRSGIDTLHQYLISADEQITADHVPAAVRYMYSRRKIDQVLKIASDLWNAMGDVNEEKIGATHDYYLKRYQLMGPKLNYNIALIDEAQDTNKVSADILLSQKNIAKILVGDHHQAIYGFRGSIMSVLPRNP